MKTLDKFEISPTPWVLTECNSKRVEIQDFHGGIVLTQDLKNAPTSTADVLRENAKAFVFLSEMIAKGMI